MKPIAFILLLILFSNIALAECIDSDSGKNKYESGTVTDNDNTYEDKCVDNNIKEYFCNVDNIASYTILPCVNGCENNECQIANEQQKAMAPETTSNNYKLYFYGLIGILIIIGYVYLFKFKNKGPSKKGYLKKKHNLEEY